jgi:TonB family protein
MHTCRTTWLSVYLLTLSATATLAAEAKSTASGFAPVTVDCDRDYQLLKRALWTAERGARLFEPDLLGFTMADYLRNHILTADIEGPLRAQRTLCRRQIANDDPAATHTLVAIRDTVSVQQEKLADIVSMVFRYRTVLQHRDAWHRIAARLPAAQPPTELAVLERQAAAQLAAGEFSALQSVTFKAMILSYSDSRQQLARKLVEMPPSDDPQAHWTRYAACGDSRPSSQNAFAKLVRGSEPQYPETARRGSQDGRTLIRVEVDERGCPQQAWVTISSGWPMLDSAVLDWMETARFLPGERNGKPVSSTPGVQFVFAFAEP